MGGDDLNIDGGKKKSAQRLLCSWRGLEKKDENPNLKRSEIY